MNVQQIARRLAKREGLFGRAERGVLNATSNAAADDDCNDDDH